MKRTRLVFVITLLAAAVVGGRLLLRERVSSVAALDPKQEVEEEETQKPPANLSATENERTTRAVAPVTEPPTVADSEEDRVAIQNPETEETRDLIVRVVDRAGTPIEGMVVELHGLSPLALLDEFESSSANLLDGGPPSLGTTDVEGRVTFEGVPASWSPLLDFGEGPYLEHQVIFAERPKRRITQADMDLGEIVSVQPDYGTVRGVVRDPYGRTGAAADDVQLELVDESLQANPEFGMERRSFRGTYENGEALFRFVELDRDWAFRALRERNFEERSLEEGPRRHLQLVEMEVQYGAKEPLLLYRILGPDGLALANADIEVRQQHAIQADQSHWRRTDERGEVLLYFNLIAYSSFNIQIRVTHTDGAGRTLHVVSPVLEDLKAGINDLGVLQLQGAQVMASGVVVDERGQAVSGAIVRMGEHVDYQEPAWFQSENVQSKSDEHGRFEFTGIDDGRSLGVWAFLGEKKSKREGLASGGSEHVLELRSLPTVSVEVLLPEGMTSRQISVQLYHEEEDGTSSKDQWDETPDLGDDGRASFRFKDVEPGSYGVLLQLTDTKEVLEKTPEVRVEESMTLATLDLRDRLHLHKLLLELPEGSEPDRQGGRYRLRNGESQEAWGPWIEYRELTLETVSTQASVDVQLMPWRFRGEELAGVRGERRVKLRDPLRVRFLLDTTGELPKHPSSLKMRIERDGKDFGFAHGGAALTENRREIEFDVPSPGTYEVRWTLLQMTESFAIEGPVLTEHRKEVTVRDQSGVQVLSIALDGEAVTDLTRNPPW